MSVYTTRLLYGEGAGKTLTYTVPDKKRVVVTFMVARNQWGSPAELWLGVHGIYSVVLVIPAFTSAMYDTLRLVAFERETVTMVTGGQDMRAILTGYLFNDPEGKPPEAKPIDPGRLAPRPTPHREG